MHCPPPQLAAWDGWRPCFEEQRSLALARPLELKDVEKSLRASVKTVEVTEMMLVVMKLQSKGLILKEETRQTLANLNNVASDEASLDAKIEKKKADLERQQKRLAQLQVPSPSTSAPPSSGSPHRCSRCDRRTWTSTRSWRRS